MCIGIEFLQWMGKQVYLVSSLAFEQSLTHEIATLVASEPNYCPAGRLVE